MKQYSKKDILFNLKHPERRYRIMRVHEESLLLFPLLSHPAIRISVSVEDVEKSGYVKESKLIEKGVEPMKVFTLLYTVDMFKSIRANNEEEAKQKIEDGEENTEWRYGTVRSIAVYEVKEER